MKRVTGFIAALALVAGSAGPAWADPHDDRHGHGHKRHRGGDYRETYWDGHCKVERKWEKGGKYKEKRTCEAPHRHAVHPYPVRHELRREAPPPAIVIQPPAIVIR